MKDGQTSDPPDEDAQASDIFYDRIRLSADGSPGMRTSHSSPE
jgi:hypothetical protein